MRHVTAMLDDARTPVAQHLIEAKAAIDEVFGPGHAAAHPDLVAAYLQAAAIDAAVAAAKVASRETNETLLKLKPRLF